MFDINAPLKQQRMGTDKVLKIVHSGLDVEFPIAAWTEFGDVFSFTNEGTFRTSAWGPRNDLHTLPEPLPLIVSYHNIHLLRQSHGYESLHLAIRNSDDGTIGVSAHTYDPNTGEASAKTVWRKGESA